MASAPTPPPSHAALVAALDSERPALLAFLERRTRDRALAEDILQDAFARALEHAADLDPERARAWLYRVLRNAVVDQWRRQRTARKGFDALASELDDAAATPDDERALCRCVTRLAAALKPEYADALQRIDVDGLSVQEAAARAGITSNNAAVRVFRARAALRARVNATCGACAARGCVDCTCGG